MKQNPDWGVGSPEFECPFCGNDREENYRTEQAEDEYVCYYYCCTNCGAEWRIDYAEVSRVVESPPSVEA